MRLLLSTVWVGSLPIANMVLSSREAIRAFEVIESVVIQANQEAVFCFAGNPLNDPEWRAEVNTMTSDGPWMVGTRYKEESTLLLNPNYVTITSLVVLDFPSQMVAETPKDALFLRSDRRFQRLEEDKTRITYTITLDERLIEDIVGLRLPVFLVKLYYSVVAGKYLRRLKDLLESPAMTVQCRD